MLSNSVLAFGGSTCDSLDCIAKSVVLPKIDGGEWLYYRNMQAYTCSAASTFNGFKKPPKFYTISQSCRPTLSKILKMFGLDVIIPHHSAVDHRAPVFSAGPDLVEIMSVVP